MPAPIYTSEQFEQLIKSLNGSYALRDKCIILFSRCQGMRASEIAHLTIGSIVDRDNVIKDWLHVPLVKTKKPRDIPLHPRVKAALAEYLASFKWKSLDEPLFISSLGFKFHRVTINALFRRILNNAGLYNHSSHSGRRTCATELSNKGAPIRHIQKLLGHSSIATTALYCEASPQDLIRLLERIE